MAAKRNGKVAGVKFMKLWNKGCRAESPSLAGNALLLGMRASSASVRASIERKRLGYFIVENGERVPLGHNTVTDPDTGEETQEPITERNGVQGSPYVLELPRGAGGGARIDVNALRAAAIAELEELDDDGDDEDEAAE